MWLSCDELVNDRPAVQTISRYVEAARSARSCCKKDTVGYFQLPLWRSVPLSRPFSSLCNETGLIILTDL